MQALIFDKSKSDWESSRGFEQVDVPEPVLGPGDEEKIVIKVAYAGVCGTDRGIWNRQAFKDQILNSIDQEMQQPLSPSTSLGALSPGQGRGIKSWRTLGHEFFGEVKDKGSRVKDINIGDMVSCESHVVCNKCFQCLNGQKNVCTNEKILGISVDGGFAEFAKVPAQVAWKTDVSKIRPEVAAMQEPFGNAVHAASKVDLKGKTVAIFGLGPIGSFLVLIARGLGAKTIIGVEPSDKALEMGKQLGVDHLIKLYPHPVSSTGQALASPLKGEEQKNIPSPSGGGLGRGGKDYNHDQQTIDQIMKLTNGLGVDVAFEMAGFNDSVNNAIASVRRGGDVILFGLKTGDFMFEDYNRLVMKGLTMHCVAGRQIWQTWEITKKLMEDKKNGVQEKLWNVLLNQGKGTILDSKDYTKERFEQMMKDNPKILLKF